MGACGPHRASARADAPHCAAGMFLRPAGLFLRPAPTRPAAPDCTASRARRAQSKRDGGGCDAGTDPGSPRLLRPRDPIAPRPRALAAGAALRKSLKACVGCCWKSFCANVLGAESLGRGGGRRCAGPRGGALRMPRRAPRRAKFAAYSTFWGKILRVLRRNWRITPSLGAPSTPGPLVEVQGARPAGYVASFWVLQIEAVTGRMPGAYWRCWFESRGVRGGVHGQLGTVQPTWYSTKQAMYFELAKLQYHAGHPRKLAASPSCWPCSPATTLHDSEGPC